MKTNWTIEQIEEGFKRFQNEFGRPPTASELRGLDYLPSIRLLQHRFGGLQKLRRRFGYKDTHFGRGKFRSKIARLIIPRGRKAELAIEEILKSKFGEIFVHTEKAIDQTRNRVDFYVYTPIGNFAVDVFHTETMRDLNVNVYIKMRKYKNFKERLLLLVNHTKFTQSQLNNYIATKKEALPQNISIVNLSEFRKFIRDMMPYRDPRLSSKQLREIHKKSHGGKDLE